LLLIVVAALVVVGNCRGGGAVVAPFSAIAVCPSALKNRVCATLDRKSNRNGSSLVLQRHFASQFAHL